MLTSISPFVVRVLGLHLSQEPVGNWSVEGRPGNCLGPGPRPYREYGSGSGQGSQRLRVSTLQVFGLFAAPFSACVCPARPGPWGLAVLPRPALSQACGFCAHRRLGATCAMVGLSGSSVFAP